MGVVLNFDATNVPTNDVREAIPTGWYNVKIVESEMKQNGKQNGHFLALTLEVIDGPHAGAKVFDNLNLDNPNPTTVEIAYKTLSSICHATGILQVPTTDVLHERPMQAKVVLLPAVAAKAADHNGPAVKGRDASNDVKGYKAYEGPAAGAAVGAPAAGIPSWANQPAAQPVAQPAAIPQAQPAATPQWTPPAQPAQAQPAAAAPQWTPPAQMAQAQPDANPAPAAAAAPAAGAMPPWMQQK